MNKQLAKELFKKNKASDRNTRATEAKIEQIYNDFKMDIAFMKGFVPKHIIEFNAEEEELEPTMYLTGSKQGDLMISNKLKEIFEDYE
jgi:hypothetical protein